MAFLLEAAATGVFCGKSFFDLTASGESNQCSILSGITPGEYGSAAAAAARDASASFLHRPMGFDLWPLLFVPWSQSALSIRGSRLQ